VLACCILHNWIIGFGCDSIVPVEEGFEYDEDDVDHGELPLEEPSMVNVKNDICNAMWATRGSSRT
jgi:hypothetical protein